MSKPKVHYFPIPGRGEFISLILEEAQVPYEYVSVPLGGHKTPAYQQKLTFGQLPAYEENDLFLTQTGAIVRYLAHKHGLAPTDPKSIAKADVVLEGTFDVIGAFFKAFFGDQAAKDNFKTSFVPTWFGYFEKLLKSNNGGNGFFVGDKLTYADLAVFTMLDSVSVLAPGAVDGFPLLKAFHERISKRPRIADYVANRRPKGA